MNHIKYAMKKTRMLLLMLICLVGFFHNQGYSQKGVVNNGAKIIVGSNTFVKISGAEGHYTNKDFDALSGRIDLDGNIVVQGNWTNNASNRVLINIDTDGRVLFTGNALQSIGGSQSTLFERVLLDNTSGLTLNNAIEVTKKFNFLNGNLFLNAYDLTMRSNAVFDNVNASKMVVVNGAGGLTYRLNNNGSFLFPLGENTSSMDFSPVNLTLNSNGGLSSAYVHIRVIDAVHPNNTSPSEYLSRYWEVSTSGITDPNFDVDFRYVNDDINGEEADIYGAKYNGAVRTLFNPVTPATNVLSIAGLTSFSDFTGCDGTKPSVDITSTVDSLHNNDPFSITIEFSEEVSGFLLSDITVNNGTQSNLQTSDNITFTADISPDADGQVEVSVGSDVAQDLAGNYNYASALFTRVYDGTKPTVSITSGESDPTNTSPFTVNILFNEPVIGFSLDSVDVVNGTKSNLVIVNDSVEYTFDITPSDGTVTVNIDSNVVVDRAGNGNMEAVEYSIEYDGTPPEVTLSSGASDPVNGTFVLNVSFDEPVSGFALGDVSVTNGTASNLVNNTPGESWDVNINPGSDGTVTVNIASGVAQDAAGNDNNAASPFTIEYDGTQPTVTLSSSSSTPTNDNPITIDIVFDEVVTGFVVGDIEVAGGSKGTLTEDVTGLEYSLPITPSGAGTITVDIPADTVFDDAGNGNMAASQFSIVFDNVDPSTLPFNPIDGATGVAPNQNLEINFNEIVRVGTGNIIIYNSGGTPFETIDVTSVQVTGDSTSTITIDPAGTFISSASYYVQIAGSAFKDVAGNYYAGINDNTTWDFEISAAGVPTVSGLLPVDNSLNVDTSSNLEITFSEDVKLGSFGTIYIKHTSDNTDFETFDVTTASELSISGATLTINPSNTFVGETGYYVLIDAGSILDLDDNPFGGINSTSYWNFTTEDVTNPTVLSLTPANGATNVSVNTTFVIEFDEDVQKASSGTISIYDGADQVIEQYNIDSSVIDITNQYVTITPNNSLDGESVYYVLVSSGAIEDLSGNPFSGIIESNIWSITTEDITGPTVSVSTTEPDPTNSTFEIQIDFNEVVTDFVAGNISVTNGSASNVQTAGAMSYTADITPSLDGQVDVQIPVGAAQDGSGNNNSESNVLSIDYDGTQPTVSITSDESVVTGLNPFDVTVTFDEVVTGFISTDITVTNGDVDSFSETTAGEVWTVGIAPTSSGTVQIDIGSSVAQDAAGNDNTAATQFSIEYDDVPPVPTLSAISGDPTNDVPIEISVSFDDDVTGFNFTDLTIGNGSATGMTQLSSSEWTVDIEAAADGDVTIDLDADKVIDDAGNGNTAATQLVIEFDSQAPVLTISSTETVATNIDPIPVTITSDETIQGMAIGDISVTNGTASNFAGSNPGTSWTVDITPDGEGTVQVDIATDAVFDLAGNLNDQTATYSVEYDVTSPDVTLSSSETGLTNVSPIPVTVTFSEAVSGFDGSQLAISNGSITDLTEQIIGIVWIAYITPAADGIVTVDLAEDQLGDIAGNLNTASNQYSVQYDGTVPGVSIYCSEPNPTSSTTFEVAIQFTEDISGFVIGDIVPDNATLSNLATVNAQQFTVDVSPVSDGTVQIAIPANVALDAANNGNSVATPFTIIFDNSSPTVDITSELSGITNANSIPVTISFSEEVTGFDIADISTTNCTFTGLSGTKATVYTGTVIPVADGNVSISIAAGSATDLAGNTNSNTANFSIDFDGTKPTVSITSDVTETTESQFTAEIIFSEAVSGFDASDVTLSNATQNSMIATDAVTYELTVTASAEGDVSISIAKDVAADLAGNTNTASNELVVLYDPATGIDDLIKDHVTIYADREYVVLEFTQEILDSYSEGMVEIYTLDGRSVAKHDLEKQIRHRFKVHEAESIYIIRLTLDKVQTNKKLFLHR